MHHLDIEASVPPSSNSSVHTAVDPDIAPSISNLGDVPSSVQHKGSESEKGAANVEEKAAVEEEKYLVAFETNDPEDPLNWPFSKKLTVSLGAVLMIFNSYVFRHPMVRHPWLMIPT